MSPSFHLNFAAQFFCSMKSFIFFLLCTLVIHSTFDLICYFHKSLLVSSVVLKSCLSWGRLKNKLSGSVLSKCSRCLSNGWWDRLVWVNLLVSLVLIFSLITFFLFCQVFFYFLIFFCGCVLVFKYILSSCIWFEYSRTF